jgi:hypothetical protein
MSYCAQATLFYGVLTTQEELERAMGLEVGEDNWEEIEETIEAAGLEVVQMGNMVLGDVDIGVSALTIEVEEGSVSVSEKMTVPTGKLDALTSFLQKHKLSGKPGWVLGATYG